MVVRNPIIRCIISGRCDTYLFIGELMSSRQCSIHKTWTAMKFPPSNTNSATLCIRIFKYHLRLINNWAQTIRRIVYTLYGPFPSTTWTAFINCISTTPNRPILSDENFDFKLFSCSSDLSNRAKIDLIVFCNLYILKFKLF